MSTLTPPTLLDEPTRLNVLQQLCLLDTPADLVFDLITQLAARYLNVPIAMVSLVDEQRQWFKSKIGVDTTETPRSQAFCAYTIQSTELLVVLDAREDPRFRDSALVTGPPFVRFYAGAPLLADERRRQPGRVVRGRHRTAPGFRRGIAQDPGKPARHPDDPHRRPAQRRIHRPAHPTAQPSALQRRPDHVAFATGHAAAQHRSGRGRVRNQVFPRDGQGAGMGIRRRLPAVLTRPAGAGTEWDTALSYRHHHVRVRDRRQRRGQTGAMVRSRLRRLHLGDRPPGHPARGDSFARRGIPGRRIERQPYPALADDRRGYGTPARLALEPVRTQP